MADRLCRLRGSQPRAHAGRAFLCRPGGLLQPGQFLRRRPEPQAGGLAHGGGRPARCRGHRRRGRLSYDLGLYRSDLDDDIVFVNSVTLNRAYLHQCRADAPAGDGRQHSVQDAALVRLRSPIPTPRRPTKAASWRPPATTRPPTPTATSPSIPGDQLAGRPGASGQAGGDLACHRSVDGRRRPDCAERAVPVRRRGQPDAATAGVRHAEPEHELPAYAARPVLCLGRERDRCQVLHVWHVLADRVGVSGRRRRTRPIRAPTAPRRRSVVSVACGLRSDAVPGDKYTSPALRGRGRSAERSG